MMCCGQENDISDEVITYLRNLPTKLHLNEEMIRDWVDYKWPYYYENNSFMFHAPVGNPYILSRNHKVKVFMSGYCVSGAAGVKYVSDVIREKNNFTSAKDAANNSFNTSAMKYGITKIVEDLGIDKLLNIAPNDIFTTSNNENSPILFTQTLCPIIIENSWKAEKVWSKLKKSKDMRKFASLSLQIWLSNLYQFCDIDTKIVLFGKTKYINCDGSIIKRNVSSRGGGELIKLLLCSFIENGIVKITNKDQGSKSLYNKIIKDFNKNIYVVFHPAGYYIHRSRYLKDDMFRKVL